MLLKCFLSYQMSWLLCWTYIMTLKSTRSFSATNSRRKRLKQQSIDMKSGEVLEVTTAHLLQVQIELASRTFSQPRLHWAAQNQTGCAEKTQLSVNVPFRTSECLKFQTEQRKLLTDKGSLSTSKAMHGLRQQPQYRGIFPTGKTNTQYQYLKSGYCVLI